MPDSYAGALLLHIAALARIRASRLR